MLNRKVFNTGDLDAKVKLFAPECHQALITAARKVCSDQPARPEKCFQVHPETLNKPGLASNKGQAWLLHDLANIELQAAELFLRSLHEYPEAPSDFRHELADFCLEEVKHLKLCLDGLEKLGYSFGDFPIHYNLWNTCSKEDSLLDRIFIVHMYLEASGLDSGDLLLRRLNFTTDSYTFKAVKTIAEDEISHVLFGTRWYKKLLQSQGLDPDDDYRFRLESLRPRLPARGSKPNEVLRKKAGFTPTQIEALNIFRAQ